MFSDRKGMIKKKKKNRLGWKRGLVTVQTLGNMETLTFYSKVELLLSYEKETILLAATWMDLEIIILSEVSQTKDKYMILLKCEI